MTDENVLEVDHNAALRCAAACQNLAVRLTDIVSTTQGRTLTGAFGTIPSGRKLAKKYSDKLNAETNSLRSAMQSHLRVVAEMEQTFRRTAEAYTTTEADNTTRLGDPSR